VHIKIFGLQEDSSEDSVISVVIPARNEVYLQKTIQGVLDATEGDVEVIAVCDGYWPDPPIQDDPRVHLIHHTEAVGQRHAINEAAMLAKGKYILKTDGHSMFDQGYDVKLATDCEKDWTVIPRMYNLDVEKWAPKQRKVTDYMFIRSPKAKKKPWRHYYFDGPCKRENPEEWKMHKRWAKEQPDIADVMTGQGACFFMHTERFWELGGMDEGHGQWGQMGIEVALKAWLSGGQLKVNKKTWFSHWFRGGGGPGFPYPIKGSDQESARKYSRDLWLNGKWPLQKRPLSWLVDKFAPVPTWNGHKEDKVARVHIDYKETRNPAPWTQQYARLQCKEPIVDVEPAYIRSCRIGDSKSIVSGKSMSVKELVENRLSYCRDDKLDGIRWQMECVPLFVKSVLDGDEYNAEKIKTLEYYRYLVSRLNPSMNPPEGPTNKGIRHAINKVKDFVRLIKDIRDNGLKSPIDMFCHGKKKQEQDRVVIIRGSRRLQVLYHLGVEKVPARIWHSEKLSETHIPTAAWPTDGDTIHAHAVRQFTKMGMNATDKYWRHGYTPWYDHHIGQFQKARQNILELGVGTGVSLLLWRDAFKKSQIYGLDNHPEKSSELVFDKSRIKVFKGHQRHTHVVEGICDECKDFGIIIDDASHFPHDQKASFEVLWKYLKSGGVYVFEDTQYSYRKKYIKDSIFPMLKDMVDDIYLKHNVREVHFYPNICFIRKA